MVTDRQVRKLRQLLAKGGSLAAGARKTNMDDKTARKYRDSTSLPSETSSPRDWRTRPDPFEEVWPEVEARLTAEPRLRAFTLFGWLQDRFPGRFPDSQRRTFERRVRDWRGLRGPNQTVMFPQIHDPGGLGASDFTSMNTLGITIARQPFAHLLYHFTLTYSNWEFVSVCFSESFEAVSSGLQRALWQLGGVPRRHRSDSLSAAVNNLSEDREFRGRYRDLMAYYQIEPQRTNARRPNENGDVESANGHVKMVIDQALLLRGSRDFTNREEYEQFLTKVIDKRNAGRVNKLREEQLGLGELPPGKLDHRDRRSSIKVNSSSTIQVKRNTYSVPSRLIGMKVDVIIDADSIEVWRAGQRIQIMPRLLGDGKHAINYRHVIDSLVRKPGALEHYQYHADMFPTSHFRMAYDDLLRQHSSRVAAREYLKILQLAARDSQDAVQDALRLAFNENQPITAEMVRVAVELHQQAPPVTEVNVELPDLNDFDSLLQHFDMEVDSYEHVSEEDQRSQATTDEH
jgi:transposase